MVREGVALAAEDLRRRLDPASLDFESTAEVEPLQCTIGRPRAGEAVAFGLEIDAFGYNLYVAGAIYRLNETVRSIATKACLFKLRGPLTGPRCLSTPVWWWTRPLSLSPVASKRRLNGGFSSALISPSSETRICTKTAWFICRRIFGVASS